MYGVFTAMALACLVLSLPNGQLREAGVAVRKNHFLSLELGVLPFTSLLVVVGTAMGIGKAAVYKYIPQYFPRDVGAVGGLVGSLGALGGFFLPPLFAWGSKTSGFPQAVFVLLFGLIVISFVWLHLTVLGLSQKAS
jgi:NNP family nitrate/nitrite transporter-like MFS transporter